MAYLSMTQSVNIFEFTWNGMIQQNMKNKEKRIHSCQKPIKLYEWLLKNYAKKGDKIFDSHGGSMSSVLACINMQFDIDCCELDKDYFKDATKRIQKHAAQLDMFRPQPEINIFE
jgi:site-specific DNA-methyltransferase (adenine-specific)